MSGSYHPLPITLSSPRPSVIRTCGRWKRRLKRESKLQAHAIDGTPAAGWVVLDYFDVMVHVMRKDVREHYDLEGLWNDAPRVRARPAAARKRAG